VDGWLIFLGRLAGNVRSGKIPPAPAATRQRAEYPARKEERIPDRAQCRG